MTSRLGVAVALAVALPGGAATAQQLVPPPEPPPIVAPGWTITPSVGAAASWDTNVALTSPQQGELADQVTTALTSFTSNHRGRGGDFLAEYRGMYDFYRRYTEFNAPDHRVRVEANHRIARHATLFAHESYSLAPTSEVPFADSGLLVLRRRTTAANDFRGGLDLTPWRRTLITAAYGLQWIDLVGDQAVQPLLRGGYAHRGDFTMRRQFLPRLALGGTYDVQHAIVSNGQEHFQVQRARALMEVALSKPLTLSASGGWAWQTAGATGSQSAPTFGAELRYQADRTLWSIGYERTYLASFGFGGTVQNKELRGSLDVPITKSFELSGRLSARDNDPLQVTGLNLRGLSAEGAALWTMVPWLRLELYAVGSRQDTQVAGGRIDRARAGVRLVTLHPMRLR